MLYDKTVREKGETSVRQAQNVMLEMMKLIDELCKKHSLEYWLDAGTLIGAVRHGGFIPWDDDLDICMSREDYEKFIEIAHNELPDELFMQTKYTDKSRWKFVKIRDNYSTYIQNSEVGRDIKYHQGIFVDIFPCDVVERDTFIPKLFINRRFARSSNSVVSKFSGLINFFSTIIVKTYGYNKWKWYFLKKYKGNTPKFVCSGIDNTFSFLKFDYDVIYPIKQIEFEGISFMAPNNPDSYLTTMFGDYMKLPAEEDRHVHAYKILPFDKCGHPNAMNY
ncbi:LicD family protein [Labilibacter sediminis]|nr:LicD family protein [Labilibacter sediminis]